MKYPDSDISVRDVQMVQLEILKELDRICRKYGIAYHLFAGTLLGAIRHRGFIPWDDDIDVCMLRKDYEKFLRCCQSDLKSDYFLQYYETDDQSIIQFAKIRKNNTIFTNKMYQDTGMHNGIFIDVFPLDNVKPDTLMGKLHPYLFQVLYAIGSSRMKNKAIHAKNLFNKTVRMFFFFLLRITPKKTTDTMTQQVLQMFNKEETVFVNHLTNGVNKKRLEKYLRDKSTFYDIILVDFEGHLFPAPKNFHEVLTRNFGDYMKLPPEEERKPHHGIIEVILS